MQIEKGIPVPTTRQRIPFDKLEMNDCLTLDVPAKQTPLEFSRKLRCAAWRAAKRLQAHFTVRVDHSGATPKIRIWRTA